MEGDTLLLLLIIGIAKGINWVSFSLTENINFKCIKVGLDSSTQLKLNELYMYKELDLGRDGNALYTILLLENKITQAVMNKILRSVIKLLF